MHSFKGAIDIIKEHSKPMRTETIPIEQALGRVLVENATATISNPAFNNSAVDGIGVSRQTLRNLQQNNTPLKIKQIILAGDIVEDITLQDDECFHIMTGAMVPSCVSSIFLIEETTAVDGSVLINAQLQDNQNIRPQGEDFHVGDILVAKSTRLQFNHISLLAASGIASVSVFKKPRVAIFTSGKETVDVGLNLPAGQIYNSNIFTMRAFLEGLGCEVITLPNVADSVSELQTNIAAARSQQADIIISSGAVSMGVEDIIKHYLLAHTTVLYNGLKIRPGKPNMLALLPNNMMYFALPGNPVSTAVALYFLVQAYYNFSHNLDFVSKSALLDDTYSKKKDFTFFLRGKCYVENGKLRVRVLEKQGSHILSSLAEANCFVKVKDNYLEKNSLCEIYEIN
ncbi:MAG: molybdopterin molybdotransferase MoeA [Alphaproteobacteria bacterium]|nr:molybdopterin molybdotransferase MoeA [Alphaproteobacteria bacterium]